MVMCHGPYLERQLLDIKVKPARLLQFNLSYQYLLHQLVETDGVLNLTENEDKTCILFAGRIDRDKGVFDLLEATSARLKERNDLLLVYVGDGPHLHTLRKETSLRSLTNQVKFMGYMEHRLLPSIIGQSRFVVTPSRRALPEGRPKAATEAIVLGKPVVAPDMQPFTYLITHGRNGLLYKPESVVDLGVQINALLDDQTLYNRVAAGAKKTSSTLLNTSLSFKEALEKAFLLSTHGF
jgi:glycosyltransferase involved in cell wall biosynthesis